MILHIYLRTASKGSLHSFLYGECSSCPYLVEKGNPLQWFINFYSSQRGSTLNQCWIIESVQARLSYRQLLRVWDVLHLYSFCNFRKELLKRWKMYSIQFSRQILLQSFNCGVVLIRMKTKLLVLKRLSSINHNAVSQSGLWNKTLHKHVQ